MLIFLFLLSWQVEKIIFTITHEKITSWTEDPKSECAIVLTGGPGRVAEGLSLLSRKQVQKLIISGVRPTSELREMFPQWPFYGLLNEKDILLEKRSRTTYGNAQQTLPIVEALKCKEILLITSQTHMNRAWKTFKSTYPENIPLLKHVLPATRQDLSWFDLSQEVVKTLFYDLWVF